MTGPGTPAVPLPSHVHPAAVPLPTPVHQPPAIATVPLSGPSQARWPSAPGLFHLRVVDVCLSVTFVSVYECVHIDLYRLYEFVHLSLI